MRKPRVKARKLVVPIAITVSIAATALTAATTAVTASAGCGDNDAPTVDAGPPDTPII